MVKKELTVAAQILLYAFTAIDMLPRPFESKIAYYKRLFSGRVPYRTFASALNSLEARGLIKIFKDSSGTKFIKLTHKGQLETLLVKARQGVDRKKKWDGKWRLVIFDIPEEARDKRDEFRWLLKINHFKLLQNSVFISPYELNREAVLFLKQSGLIRYIRILKVEEIDDDRDLKKHFGLV